MSDNVYKYAVQSICIYVDCHQHAREIARQVRSIARVKATTQIYRMKLLPDDCMLVMHIDNGTGSDLIPQLKDKNIIAYSFNERCTEGYDLERWNEQALELVTYRYGHVMTRKYI